jgi:hypothetical protein
MKVLSLLQPWASLWVSGQKRIETRSWGTSYRGRIAVAASKGFGLDAKRLCTTEPFAQALHDIGINTLAQVPRGVILGWVTLVDCLPMGGMLFPLNNRNPHLTPAECAFGNYGRGRSAWLTGNDRFILAEPIPFKGTLGLQDLDPEIAARLA